jgi:hypothetical protein
MVPYLARRGDIWPDPFGTNLLMIAVFRSGGAARFPTIFFDHSYIFAPASFDVHHLKNSTDPLGFCGAVIAAPSASGQH